MTPVASFPNTSFIPYGNPYRSVRLPRTYQSPYKKPLDKVAMAEHIGIVVGAVALAIGLHKVPPNAEMLKNPELAKWFSLDWKDYGRMALALLAKSQLNQACNWQPPTWLNVVETMGFLGGLTSKKPFANWQQLAVLTPLIAGVVEGGQWLNQHAAQPLQDHWHIPKLATSLGVTGGTLLISFLGYPQILSAVASTKILGADMAKQATQKTLGWVTGCAAGCCPSVICFNELAGYVGTMGDSIKKTFAPPAQAQDHAL